MENKILSKYKNVHDHLIQCGFEYDYDHHKGYTYQLNDIIIHASIDTKINEADNEIVFFGIKYGFIPNSYDDTVSIKVTELLSDPILIINNIKTLLIQYLNS